MSVTTANRVNNNDSGLVTRTSINSLIGEHNTRQTAERIYRLEDYGGWGRSDVDLVISLNITAVSHTASGTSKKMRLTVGSTSGLGIPTGASMTIAGLPDAANNGDWWVDQVNATTIDFANPNCVDNASCTGTATYLDIDVTAQDFEFNADGTANTGTTFDNAVAAAALLADVQADYQVKRPMALHLELGPKIYPISMGAFNLLGFDSIIVHGPGRAQGGFFVLDHTTASGTPHLFYINQPFGGVNTTYVDLHDFFIVANRQSHTIDVGDYGPAGTGDLVHFAQKVGGETWQTGGAVTTAALTARSSQFDSKIGGVDPRIRVRNMFISGAPRHGVYLKGRGDCHVDNNLIGTFGVNGVRLQLFDSYVTGNIIANGGEAAVYCEAGCNNIKFLNNLYYFNGTNAQGYLTTADAQDAWENRLCTAYLDCSNVQIDGDCYEDTSGPALVLNSPEGATGFIDINNPCSLGPATSDRDENAYSGLNIVPSGSALAWYGALGLPAIKIVNGSAACKNINFKVLWRSGRSGNPIRNFMELHRNTSGAYYRDIYLDVQVGHFKDLAPKSFTDQGDPKMTDPHLVTAYAQKSQWWGLNADGSPNTATGQWMTIDESQRQQNVHNTKIVVDGMLDPVWHGRSRKAWWSDTVDRGCREVVFETAAPTKFAISAATTSTATPNGFSVNTIVLALSTDLTTANAPLFNAPAEVFGLSNAINNGLCEVRALSTTADTLTLDRLDSTVFIAEPSPSGAYVETPGRGQAPVRAKELGARTKYYLKTMGVDGVSGYKASITATGLSGAISSFLLDRQGEIAMTEVDIGGEQIVACAQAETLTDADYTLKPTDFGKMLMIPATTARTVTAPTASTLPDDFWCDLVLTGAGSLLTSGATAFSSKSKLTVEYTAARFRKISSSLVTVEGPNMTT